MATTTGSFQFYNTFREYMADGTIDLDTDTFNITLHTVTYGALDTTHLDAHSVYADLTNELATANGYDVLGQALTGVTWARVGALMTFDCIDPLWNIITADVVARYFIIRKVGTANAIVDPLVGIGYLDNTPLDVTTTPGNLLTVAINASGLFTLG